MYEFDKFRFDPANHLLLSEDDSVPLTPKAFDVLLVLVQNGKRLTTKEELIAKVWPDSFVEEANLTVNISALRKALGETSNGKQYIETVPKKGYRFVAPVKEVSEKEEGKADIRETPSAKDAQEVAQVAQPNGQAIPARSYARSLAGAFGILLLFSIAGLYFLREPRVARLGPHRTHQVAVLPFQNLRENKETDFLGFSLADAVITKLGYVSQLSVRPSYSVQRYKSQPQDIRKVAHDLNVDTLLTGTFLREGDELRISCQLIDANAESILWKGTYDLKYEKLLTVEDEVSEQIIKGLELTLSPSEAERLKANASIPPLAYEYYLRGVDLYSKSDFPMAIKMLEKSTELAPNYALGWANLGKSYTANASFQLAGAEQYEKAQSAFERALALESDQIDARIYMANMFTDTGRVEKAVPLLREALRTNPNHAEIHWELGYAYRFAGMLQESVAESELARRLDPGVKLYSSTLNSHLYLGNYDKFLEGLPKSDDQPLIVFYRGFAEYYKKDWNAAGSDFDHAYDLDRSLLQAQIGKAISFSLRKQNSRGLGILRDIEERINQRAVGDPEATYKVAQAYAVLGDQSSSLRVLKRSIDRGFFPYPYLSSDPLLYSVRKRPDSGPVLAAAQERYLAFAKAFF